MAGDRNFDDLAHRFAKNVYESQKGQIRLRVLERDLREHVPALYLPSHSLQLLDAGCGRAGLSIPLMRHGHELTLVDVSVEMLKHALADAEAQNFSPRWFHGPLAQYHQQHWPGQKFDVIFCHALLEWVAEPEALLAALRAMLAPGGFVSLIFYNEAGLVFKNLLRTNFKKIASGQLAGARRSLTPRYPRAIEAVQQWCAVAGFTTVCHSGIRVFHDYIFSEQDRDREPEQLQALELSLSRQSPYRELGRYQHLLLSVPE